MNNEVLLDIERLSISYDTKLAVNDVSLSIKKGSIVTIVGQSGSGKSTLIHAILGLLSPNATIVQGSIMYKNYALHKMTPSMRRSVSGPEISMIFQNSESHMDPIKRIKSQFNTYIRAHQKVTKQTCKRLEVEALSQMGFKDPERILNSYPFQLSGGMQQRVALAMAMVLKPALILADEPTSALDVTLQKQIAEHIVSLSRSTQTAVLLVTHNMGVAAYISDNIAVMNQGKLVEFGTRDQIIKAPKMAYTQKLLAAVPSLNETRLIYDKTSYINS